MDRGVNSVFPLLWRIVLRAGWGPGTEYPASLCFYRRGERGREGREREEGETQQSNSRAIAERQQSDSRVTAERRESGILLGQEVTEDKT